MRYRWIVNPRFQVKYTLVIVGLTALLLGVLGYVYWDMLNRETALLGLRQLTGRGVSQDLTAQQFDRELRQEARREDASRLRWLIVVSGVLVVGLAVAGLKTTHRIAGPVYVVSRTLRRMAMGDWNVVRPLRKKDEFRFLYEDLLALREAVKRNCHKSIALMENVLETLDTISLSQDADRPLVEELKREIKSYIEQQQKAFKELNSNET